MLHEAATPDITVSARDIADRIIAMVDKQLAAVRGETQFSVKSAFRTLLSTQDQRRVFLYVCSNINAWPYLILHFGAPPYNFLEPGDASQMRAAGISHSRTNMSTVDVCVSSSASQFGCGQFIDNTGRRYRSSSRLPNVSVAWSLPDMPVAQGVVQIEVNVATKTHPRSTRLQRGITRHLPFPRVGEVLELSYTPEMKRFQLAYEFTLPIHTMPVSVQVRRIVKSANRNVTAALFVSLLAK